MIKFLQWTTIVLKKLIDTNQRPQLAEFLSKFHLLYTLLREQRYLPAVDMISCTGQLQEWGVKLNAVIYQLSRVLRACLGWKTEGGMNAQEEQDVLSCADSASKLSGYFLLGNLNLFPTDQLTELTHALINTLYSFTVPAFTPVEEQLAETIYGTLSHLVFIRSMWTHKSEKEMSDGVESDAFLSADATLYVAVFDAFIAGLRQTNPMHLAGKLNPTCNSGSGHIVTTQRATVVACLNGLSQLLLRRTTKLVPDKVTGAIRELWPHVIGAHRSCMTGSSSRAQDDRCSDVGSVSDTNQGEMTSGRGRVDPSGMIWNHGSTSSDWPDSSSASEDSFHTATSSSGEDSLTASTMHLPAIISTDAIATSLLQRLELDQTTASGVSTTSTASVAHSGTVQSRLGKTTASATTTTGTRKPKWGRGMRFKVPGFKSDGKIKNQFKSYTLAVFNLRALLESGRVQIVLDAWPVLMSSDNWIPMSSRTEQGDYPDIPSEVVQRLPMVAHSPDLLNLIYRTADTRIRQMLIDVLICLLSGVGRRFAFAEDLTPHSASFVPYSVRLAVELRHLHRRLLMALATERCVGLQALLLKALTTLVLITPYQRLQPGLLTSLLPALHRLINLTMDHQQRNVDLRAGCLSLLGNIMGKVPGPLLEVCQLLTREQSSQSMSFATGGSNEVEAVVKPKNTARSSPYSETSTHSAIRGSSACWSSPQDQHMFTPCWLVQVCLRMIHPDLSAFAWDTPTSAAELATLQPLQVRIQAVAVLRDMVTNYAGFLRPSLPVIQEMILLCLQDTEETRVLWTPILQFLEHFLTHLARVTLQSTRLSEDTTVDSQTTMELSGFWWRAITPGLLYILKNARDISDRLWSCKIFSQIDAHGIQFLLSDAQLSGSVLEQVISTLSETCDAKDEHLKAKAIRGLGAIITWHPLNENVSLIRQVLQLSQNVWLSDRSVSTGLDVAWTLASTLEVVVTLVERSDDSQNGCSQILDVLTSEWSTLVSVCCDVASPQTSKLGGVHVPVRTQEAINVKHPGAHRCEQGARAIGCLLRLLRTEQSHDQRIINLLFQTMAETTVTEQVCSSEKIRWHANYSVAHLFHNKHLEKELLATHLRDVPINISDPVLSIETVLNVNRLVNHLTRSFTEDKYFKARVYAGNSLLSLIVPHVECAPSPSMLTVINRICNTQHGEPINHRVESRILNAAVDVLRAVPLSPRGVISSTSSDPVSDRLTPIAHLTENQYRFQCVCTAATLLYYALLSLLRDPPSCDSEKMFITSQLKHSFLSSGISENLIHLHQEISKETMVDQIISPVDHWLVSWPKTQIIDLADSLTPFQRLRHISLQYEGFIHELKNNRTTGEYWSQLIPNLCSLCLCSNFTPEPDSITKDISKLALIQETSGFRSVYD